MFCWRETKRTKEVRGWIADSVKISSEVVVVMRWLVNRN
jgi:ribosomal protein S24E